METIDHSTAGHAGLEDILQDNTALHMKKVAQGGGDVIGVLYGREGGIVTHNTQNNVNGHATVWRKPGLKSIAVIDSQGDETDALGVIIDHLQSQARDGARKHIGDANRARKPHRRNANGLGLSTSAVRGTARSGRKMKPSIRRSRQGYGQKPVHAGEVLPAAICAGEFTGNKAENNNWMLDAEDASSTQATCVIPTLHSRSCTPCLSLAQANLDCKSLRRPGSVDDSCAVLSLPTQGSNVSSDCNLDNYSPNGGLVTRSVAESQGSSDGVGVCATCGTETQKPKCAFCKNCSARNRADESRNGPLDELKAYAQSFANSVKKILLNSPVLEQSSEMWHSSVLKEDNEESTKSAPQEETLRRKHGPELCLSRYMTEINMTSRPEARSKSLMSKSMSYDGRVGTSTEENASQSSIKWIRHNRVKASDSLSKVAEYSFSGTDRGRFATGKESEDFLVTDEDKNTRINKSEKMKTKFLMKQLARVERARTDGDLRMSNPQTVVPSKKPVKDEPKKGFEFQRNRSKTFHELDTGSVVQDCCSPQREEVLGLSISRLKVIHEGSPVDPPNTADGRKGDDGRGRKAVFIRSATAPYKNHGTRKEIPAALPVLDSPVRTNRSNTKITVRTNKASTLRKENSLSERRNVQDVLMSFADETSEVTSKSFTKRRSTSYDSSQLGTERDESHKISSWSIVEGDDEEHTEDSSTTGIVSGRQNLEKHGTPVHKDPPSGLGAQAENQTKADLPVDPFLYNDLPTITSKSSRSEAVGQDPSVEQSRERFPLGGEDKLELLQSRAKYDSETERVYYNNNTEKQPSPYVEVERPSSDTYDIHSDSGSYYTENPNNSNQGETNTLLFDHTSVSSVPRNVDDEGVYHDEIDMSLASDTSGGKNSPWYSPLQVLSSDDRTLARRDRSLESKSTTSFHLVTTAKSSHSDEALTKWSVVEHAWPRRQSMYTETDVDTGVIYHLAKRQTTRAHVPPYHDLTSGFREIYTMSGDVSKSTSSNSTTSTSRSELSEYVYTGGFYRDDPFNDAGGKEGRASRSDESSSSIYFESTYMSKRSEPGEVDIDIYTGGIFNSNQNTMAPAPSAGTNSGTQVNEAKGSRIVTSARSAIGRIQRSVRCRPRFDAFTFKNSDSAWEYLSQPIVIYGENKCYNISNNSNNWYGMEEIESACPSGTIITTSADPLYTDYDPGMRPEFHVRHIEKSESVFDFLKYDSTDEPDNPFTTPPRMDDPSSDSMWYSGLLHGDGRDRADRDRPRAQPTVEKSPYAWQYYDDYYTSRVRPIVSNTNNCRCCSRGCMPCDANNNHFDDIYTGSYGAQNVPSSPQEQQSQASRQAPPVDGSWYVKQPTPTHTSATFPDQGYEACYTVPGQTSRSAPGMYESLRDQYSNYAPPKMFGQEPPAPSESSLYLVDDSWWKYGPKPSNQFEEPQPRRPQRPASTESDSYFDYAEKRSPEKNFYVIDDDTYSFEQKVESETPEPPAVKEIKTVGGIVCRENVVNKDDYAEDINRDLEPGAWAPFSFRREEDIKYPQETAGGHDKQDMQRTSDAAAAAASMKHVEETYANNRLYDNLGARKNWQRTPSKAEAAAKSRDSSPHRALQAGDTGKQDYGKSLHRNSSDIIPDKARGKRGMSNIPKTTAAENNSGTNKSSGSSTATKNKRR